MGILSSVSNNVPISLHLENSPKQEAGISEGQGTAGEEEEKKKQKRGEA